MLKCESCELEFSETGPKSDVLFNEICPRCKSYEIIVFNKSNPIYRLIIVVVVLVLFLSTIVFPILW